MARVRDGASFATRAVTARQRGRPVLTATVSLMREGAGGAATIAHEDGIPADVDWGFVRRREREGDASARGQDGGEGARRARMAGAEGEEEEDWEEWETVDRGGGGGPMEKEVLAITDEDAREPQRKRLRSWIRARGRLAPAPAAHLAALAYVSDSWFVGTVARAHGLPPYGTPPPHQADLPLEEQKEVAMMVSLDHTVYFHRPRAVRADRWMLSEMETPWSGDGRGLVMQRIWARDGALVATCVQEGLARVRPREEKL